ncbi:MAG: caspase family protein [Acidobacteriota bacterium]
MWLPQAEAGNAEAQYFVGQIFEKGLGGTPDPESAAAWYQKAAEQDFGPAQINLGYLYEEGLGVEQDEVAALNWYRRAAGLAADLVVLEESEYQELLGAQSALRAKQQEVDALESEIEEIRRQLESTRAEAGEADRQAEARHETLRSILSRLESDLDARRQEVDRGRLRITELEKQLEDQGPAAAGSARLADLSFGDFHALVIGNSAYRELPKLEAADDARTVARLLERKYGFEVRLLLDADRFTIMNALNELREQLTREDRLLVYYAGHGKRDVSGQTAYWQPVDAQPNNPVNWIPSAVVAEHLDLIASNHVFVVADSVFSGLRTRSSIAQLRQGMTEEERYFHIRLLLDRRSRLVLSSGALAPAPAGAEGTFASAFASVLESNDGVLEASRLYEAVNDRLFAANSDAAGLRFATLKWARNDLADFFFVPRDLR